MKQGTAAWTRSEITKTDLRLTDLESQRVLLEQARKALLLVDDDRDRRVVSGIENGMSSGELFIVHDPDARRLLDGWNGRGMGAIRHEIAELRERRVLLQEQLPSEEEVAAAQKQAAELVKRATGQSDQFKKSWSTFMAAMSRAESTGRQVVLSQSEAQATIRELSELHEGYGLEVAVPREPKPDPGEANLAGIMCLLLKDVGYSQAIDQQVDVELASALRQFERQAV